MKKTQAKRLAILAQMFERLVEWGWEDAPTGRLVHRGDFPIASSAGSTRKPDDDQILT